jgi:ABC-type lipopolysaccharide export system ATPase subunit
LVKTYREEIVVKGIVEVNQGEIVGFWDLMALEKTTSFLYDCVGSSILSNSYLDDLNNLYKRAVGYLAQEACFAKTSNEKYLECSHCFETF